MNRPTKAAKLTLEKVLEIKDRYAEGESQGSLARRFAISVGQIGRIVRGEAWVDSQRFEPLSPGPTPSKEEVDASFNRLMGKLNEAAVTEPLERKEISETVRGYLGEERANRLAGIPPKPESKDE